MFYHDDLKEIWLYSILKEIKKRFSIREIKYNSNGSEMR